jgi:hypothetical protein
MRASGLGALLGVAALVGGVGVATADRPGKQKSPAASDPDRLELSAADRDELIVLHDGSGRYLVTARGARIDHDHLYYGDGKVFYQQRIYGGGSDGATGDVRRYFWEPRTGSRASFQRRKGDYMVHCGDRTTGLTQLPEDQARAMIDQGAFMKPLWKRQAYALSRDERGNYYYVDRLRDDYGGKGFRMFMGPKGRLKPQRMTNIVSDSEGDIFATRGGELRFILSRNESTWIRGKRRTELTNVPVERNVQMIYSELGVYLEPLGTPCDDL